MERFEYIENLAEGAYGVVWLCQDHDNNQRVAMKRFKEAHTDPEVMRLALREVRMLKAAQHPNVVKMLEAFRSKSGRVYIAMEYIPATLTNDLRKYHGKGMPPLLAKVLAWQLLQAVNHLHKLKMMHRDLKPANILITQDRELKLCDFGFARTLHPRVVAEYTTYVVTRWYRAPEILVSDSYGPKVDVWAVGCLLGEMVGGRPLFPGKNSANQLWLTCRTLGPLPPNQMLLMATDSLYTDMSLPTGAECTTLAQRFPQYPEDLLDLLHKCLALDPDERLSAAEALEHPYFQDVPQILEAVQTSDKTPAEFWAKVEESWLAVVEANGGVVSSSKFRQNTQAHGLLNSIPTSIMTPNSYSSTHTPGAAPREWQRRRFDALLTSTNGALLDTQNSIMSNNTDLHSSVNGLLDSQGTMDLHRCAAGSQGFFDDASSTASGPAARSSPATYSFSNSTRFGPGPSWDNPRPPSSSLHHQNSRSRLSAVTQVGQPVGDGASVHPLQGRRSRTTTMSSVGDPDHTMGEGAGGQSAPGSTGGTVFPPIRSKPNRSSSGPIGPRFMNGAVQMHSNLQPAGRSKPHLLQTVHSVTAPGALVRPPSPRRMSMSEPHAAVKELQGASDGAEQVQNDSIPVVSEVVDAAATETPVVAAGSKGFLGKLRHKVRALLNTNSSDDTPS